MIPTLVVSYGRVFSRFVAYRYMSIETNVLDVGDKQGIMGIKIILHKDFGLKKDIASSNVCTKMFWCQKNDNKLP